MEQSKKSETEPNDEILRGIIARVQAAQAPGPFSRLIVEAVRQLAYTILDERDARRAIGRLAEQRDNRLQGEIAERSQRQLEITGRLAVLERRMAMRDVVVTEQCNGKHPPPACGDAECWQERTGPSAAAIELARMHAVSCDVRHSYLPATHEEAKRWMPHSWVVDAIMAVQRDLASARADVATRSQVAKEAARNPYKADAKVSDLRAQVAALQKAIDDVWALVEWPDGYGSPYWSVPGLDDTTPAQAIEHVLRHLRRRRNPANAEAMAALNEADRQSDDDQICGC